MAPSSRAVSRVKRRKVVRMAKLLHPLNTMGWETTRGKGTGVYKGEAGLEDRGEKEVERGNEGKEVKKERSSYQITNRVVRRGTSLKTGHYRGGERRPPRSATAPKTK